MTSSAPTAILSSYIFLLCPYIQYMFYSFTNSSYTLHFFKIFLKHITKKTKLRGLSSRANYTGRAIASCWRS
jgi:hypothetical protein